MRTDIRAWNNNEMRFVTCLQQTVGTPKGPFCCYVAAVWPTCLWVSAFSPAWPRQSGGSTLTITRHSDTSLPRQCFSLAQRQCHAWGGGNSTLYTPRPFHPPDWKEAAFLVCKKKHPFFITSIVTTLGPWAAREGLRFNRDFDKKKRRKARS
jgi:hypothetical protein